MITTRLLAAVLMKIEGENAVSVGRALQYFGMA
jgi:hypothetical protein